MMRNPFVPETVTPAVADAVSATCPANGTTIVLPVADEIASAVTLFVALVKPVTVSAVPVDGTFENVP